MIGKMNRRVTCTNYTITKNTTGGAVSTPQTPFIVWAQIEDRSGSFQNSQANNKWEYDYKVTMRFTGAITSKTVLQYETQKMKIQSLVIQNEGMKNYLVARCSKITI